MARPRNKIPSYLLHQQSGQARVRIHGRDIYLGPFGTPESKEAYASLIAEHFANENYGVVKDPKVEVVYDDARHFILTTRDKFDIITSDPINPWVKGAATLYTREYFELCKSRLNERGVITQWVPLYESNVAAVKSELATFFGVEEHAMTILEWFRKWSKPLLAIPLLLEAASYILVVGVGIVPPFEAA